VGVGGIPGGDKVAGVDVTDAFLSGKLGEPGQEDEPK
jgi:hypothetical protein